MANEYQTEHPEWRHYRVAHGALVEDGRLLLVGNLWDPAQPLVWTLPGGRCEAGEPAVAAVVREFREETGLAVAAGPLIYVAEARSVKRRLHFLTCAFIVARRGGSLTCAGDPAVRDLRHVPLDELGAVLAAPSLGAPVRYWLEHPGAPVRYWFFPEYADE